MSAQNSDKKRYFEDIQEGETLVSNRRTITETDIVQFAGLSGDFNPLHMDEVFAKGTMFKQRIAHGLLGLSITSGLQAPEMPWAIEAFMGLDWKFVAPIFIGDTVHFTSSVLSKRDLKKGKGIVKISRELRNQDNEVTQKGTWTLLLAKKEA